MSHLKSINKRNHKKKLTNLVKKQLRIFLRINKIKTNQERYNIIKCQYPYKYYEYVPTP